MNRDCGMRPVHERLSWIREWIALIAVERGGAAIR